MAKISLMTPATAIAGADLIPIVQGGINKKSTASLLITQVKTLVYEEVTASGGYTFTGSKDAVGFNKTVSDATAVTVTMASLMDGVKYTIKDVKGDCDTYNITITPDSGTIEGASSYVLNNPFQAVTFFKSGTKLIAIG